jgi:hypothetical protein
MLQRGGGGKANKFYVLPKRTSFRIELIFVPWQSNAMQILQAHNLAMPATINYFLFIGAMLSAIASALHVGCIIFGAPWYRFFGAGEKMARLAEAGSAFPTLVTAVIAAVLLICSAYALSGAGVLPRLPFLRVVLCAFTLVYLLRGFLFFAFIPLFPGNSLTFWFCSGAICAVIGLTHLIGIYQKWPFVLT